MLCFQALSAAGAGEAQPPRVERGNPVYDEEPALPWDRGELVPSLLTSALCLPQEAKMGRGGRGGGRAGGRLGG